jgi:hypothetical protein
LAAIAGALGNGNWGHIVGTYDNDVGLDNQHQYLNARGAQMSNTAAVSLDSNPLGMRKARERRRRSLQRPSRRSSRSRTSSVPTAGSRPPGIPGATPAIAEAEEQEGGELAGAGVVVCLMV